MSNRSRIFPQVSNYRSENSPLRDFTNQYSILNKRKGKNSFDQFSMSLALKLPQINKNLQRVKRQTNSTHQNILNDKQYQQEVNIKLNQLKSFISQFQKFNPYVLPNPMSNQYNYGGYPQYPNMNYPPMYGEYGEPPQNQGQNKLGQQKKGPAGPNNKKVLRKFRKIGMVHYSKAFTINRFKYIYNKFLKNNQIKVLEYSQKMVRKIQQIELLDLIIKLPKSIKNFQKFNLQSATIISQNASLQQILPSKAKDQFQKALNFINLYLKSLRQILLSSDFLDQFSQFISLGTINQSFMIDHFYLRQQANFINFSQQKGYLKISHQLQNLLFIISIFGKHILDRILFPIKKNKYFQQKLKQQQSQLESISNLSQDFNQVYNLIHISSNILYVLINNIHLEYFHEVYLKENTKNKKKQINVELMKQLKIPGYKRKEKQQYDQQQLILGVELSKQIDQLIDQTKYQQYLGYLVSEIQNLIADLWENVKKINKIHYQNIKQITLKQTNIILNGIKSNNQGRNQRQSQKYSHKPTYSSFSSKVSKISLNRLVQKKKSK